ncbi:GMC family oxidoreductase [Sphingomonas montanisoli]|uniref:Glucose-methanol-choline oxidoreductase n=1 Tax=Sphingomonas montanisoli TaxID=2606412 RepID=A0A5D9C6G7_9SPHN|nr:GMC family oxidoreductase N-terminal domain-containing protein [Sphingomonas montanisoli]TZG27394.1 glucose-methanol-choline oxidoreductase [Sphingomonas montanisoli]
MLEADYVIIGAGSAGCVLANRLSEDPNVSVVLLEAGGKSDTLLVNMPVGSVKLMGNPDYDWMYLTEPDPSIKGRQVLWISGKMLGGGSAINGTIYIRGSKTDYDSWADKGCTGWSWDEVLPFFKKAENYCGPDKGSDCMGHDGPLSVEPIRSPHPMTEAFVQACAETGLTRIEDYCAGDVDGVFHNFFTQKSGRRSSTYEAFLKPIKGRKNLIVLTGALVDKVVFDDAKRAVGVRYRDGNVVREIKAKREVVVSAGAIHSPAVLLRSGIGPADELRELGIDVVVDAPEVGKNLQEHASVHQSRFVDLETLNSAATPLKMPFHFLQYLFSGTGILTSPPVQAIANTRSQSGLNHPNIKLSFGPVAVDHRTRQPHKRAGVTIFVNCSPPKSRGEIRLRSANAADKPVVDHRLLGSTEDIATMIAAMKQCEEIFKAPALAKHVVGRLLPDEEPKTDAEWEDYIRSTAGIGFHPVSSCRMGGDARSVVDPTLKVRGVSGLRVIDASIMPDMPAANTNAPTIMIGEKGADLIKNEVR